MTWRTIVVSSNCKLDLKLNYLIVRSTEIRKVHLSEISVLIIESTAVSMTAMLLCELSRRKIMIIFCDETHNPYGELIPFHGSHDSPSKLRSQIAWTAKIKNEVWKSIVQNKIYNQSIILERYDIERANMLKEFSKEVQPGDSTNREGHAAKVYFNTIFNDEFSRKKDCIQNSCLNYGYAILLSAVNREISSLGYSTELGIFHDNTYNQFNFGCDLMEPIRPLVDRMVLDMEVLEFTTDTKRKLAGLLNQIVKINGRSTYLLNALPIYVKSVTDSLTEESTDKIRFCVYEGTCNENNSILRSSYENIQ